MKFSPPASLLPLLAAMSLSSLTTAKADIIIDPFNSYQSVSLGGDPPGAKNTFSALTDPVTLGGERDVWLSRTSSNSGSVSVDVNGSFSGALAYASSPNTLGYAVITYDGTDGASGINYTGLGNVDLTQSGANTGIALATTSDNGASAQFTIYTDATHFSTFNVPVASDPSFTFTRYFASFSDFSVGSGAFGGADFKNV